MESHSQLFDDLLFELCKYNGGIPIDSILNADTETEAINIISETIILKNNKSHCDDINNHSYCPHCGHKL